MTIMAAPAENLQPKIPREMSVVFGSLENNESYIAVGTLCLIAVVESLILSFKINPETFSLIVSGTGFLSACIWFACAGKFKSIDAPDIILFSSMVFLICDRALGLGEGRSNYFSLLISSPALLSAIWLGWNISRKNSSLFSPPSANSSVTADSVPLISGKKMTLNARISEGSVAVVQQIEPGVTEFQILGIDDEISQGSMIVDGSGNATPLPGASKNDSSAEGLKPHHPKSLISEFTKAAPFIVLSLLLAAFPVYFFDLQLNAFSILSSFLLVTLLLVLPEQMNAPFRSKRDVFEKLGLRIRNAKNISVLSGIKEIFITAQGKNVFNQIRVTKAEIFDDRLDKKQVITLVANLAANLESPLWRTLSHFCYECLAPHFKLMPLSEVKLLNETGIAAVIQGVEFSLGDELFLINRGVHLDPSEIGPAAKDTLWIYISLAGSLIARFAVNRSLEESLEDLRPQFLAHSLKAKILQVGEGYHSEVSIPSLVIQGINEPNAGATLSASSQEGEGDIALSRIPLARILDAVMLAKKTVFQVRGVQFGFYAVFALSLVLIFFFNPSPVGIELALLFFLIIVSLRAPSVPSTAS